MEGNSREILAKQTLSLSLISSLKEKVNSRADSINGNETAMVVSSDQSWTKTWEFKFSSCSSGQDWFLLMRDWTNIFHWLDFKQNQPPLANNPFADSHCPQPLMPIQPPVEDILFARTIYVKKLIEECNNTEDTAKLLKVSHLNCMSNNRLFLGFVTCTVENFFLNYDNW